MLQRTLIVAMLWLTSDALAADAPTEVTDAVKKKYPDARIVSVKQEKERNKGKPIYYVSLERGKEEMDVDVDADGKIFSEETQVEFSAVPEHVQKTLKNSPYAGWTVKRVERVILGEKEDTTHFEILVQKGKQQKELVFGPDGKLEKVEAPKKNHRGAAKKEVEQMEAKERPPTRATTPSRCTSTPGRPGCNRRTTSTRSSRADAHSARRAR